ncbi:MAG: proton-conducting transporter membrane subunit, partial [Spirochaeta sp.]|nr:proton-conducting transporter membrane subunit [Spirochaeta sp.]
MSPVVLLIVPLGAAFVYPLVEKIHRRLAAVLTVATTLALFGIALSWVFSFAAGALPLAVATAGFPVPFSIGLAVGLSEAVVLAVITLIGALGVTSGMTREDDPWSWRQIVLFFVLMLGSFGLVLSQDLFNIFVFMEISGISVFGLLGTSRDTRAFEAGFKYMIASGLASVFFLIGVAFIYATVGSLHIADIVSGAGSVVGATGVMALVFLAAALLIELKPAPANGWALDTYQAADPALGALISGVNATAMVVVFQRLMPIFLSAARDVFIPVFLVAGILAFLIPQIQALMQSNLRRMLGYSSVAQIGLVLLVLVIGPGAVSFGAVAVPAAIVLLLNHGLAKAGLFWVVNVIGDERTGVDRRWPHSIRGRKRLLVFVSVLVLALLGLPPFPGFWAKWNLVTTLGGSGLYGVLAVVLVGSTLEAVYLMRWFTALVRSEGDDGAVVGERIPADFAPPEDEFAGAAGGGCPDTGCTPSLACSGMAMLV